MILQYPRQGPEANPNGFTWETIDTDSLDMQQRAQWAQKLLNATGYYIRSHVSMYDFGVPDTLKPGGTVVFTSADVVFTGVKSALELNSHNTDEYSVDAQRLLNAPSELMTAVTHLLNLAIPESELQFRDPDDATPPVLADWQTPGARIGPPVASKPGWFMNRYLGDALGTVWTGPSGARYQMSEEGSFMSRFVGWKKL